MVSRRPGGHRSYNNRAEQRPNHSILRLSEAGPWAKPTTPYPTTIGKYTNKYIYTWNKLRTNEPAREPAKWKYSGTSRVERSVYTKSFFCFWIQTWIYNHISVILEQVIFWEPFLVNKHIFKFKLDYQVIIGIILTCVQMFILGEDIHYWCTIFIFENQHWCLLANLVQNLQTCISS